MFDERTILVNQWLGFLTTITSFALEQWLGIVGALFAGLSALGAMKHRKEMRKIEREKLEIERQKLKLH